MRDSRGRQEEKGDRRMKFAFILMGSGFDSEKDRAAIHGGEIQVAGVTAMDVGEDCLLLLQGGSRPHIGCAVLAVPRPSLKNPEETSSTASVLNVSGHKDEYLCRYLAEKTAARTGKVTVCTGGFHTDHITEGQIREVMDAMEEILASL